MIETETIPCRFECGRQTDMLGTRMCHPCFELRTALLYSDRRVIDKMLKLLEEQAL